MLAEIKSWNKRLGGGESENSNDHNGRRCSRNKSPCWGLAGIKVTKAKGEEEGGKGADLSFFLNFLTLTSFMASQAKEQYGSNIFLSLNSAEIRLSFNMSIISLSSCQELRIPPLSVSPGFPIRIRLNPASNGPEIRRKKQIFKPSQLSCKRRRNNICFNLSN